MQHLLEGPDLIEFIDNCMFSGGSVKDIDSLVTPKSINNPIFNGREWCHPLSYYFQLSNAAPAGVVLENPQLLKVLLERGANPSLSWKERDVTVYPIFLAIARAVEGYDATLKLLLQYGADPNVTVKDDEFNMPMLHYVLCYYDKNKNNEAEVKKIIKLLLKAGAKPSMTCNIDGKEYDFFQFAKKCGFNWNKKKLWKKKKDNTGNLSRKNDNTLQLPPADKMPDPEGPFPIEDNIVKGKEKKPFQRTDFISLIVIASSAVVPTIVLPLVFMKWDLTKQFADLIQNRFIESNIIEKISNVVFVSIASAIFAFSATLICNAVLNAIHEDSNNKIYIGTAFAIGGLALVSAASMAVLQELLNDWLERPECKIAIVSISLALAAVNAILLTFIPFESCGQESSRDR